MIYAKWLLKVTSFEKGVSKLKIEPVPIYIHVFTRNQSGWNVYNDTLYE